jgi:lysozyme family protein
VRFLQASVGCPVDGDFGPQTAQAAGVCDVGASIAAYCDTRERFYRRLAEQRPELAVFLKGWMNRLDALRKEIGLPGYEGVFRLDFGDAGYIAKVPDLGEDPDVTF